ncbi:pre-mRNA-splicing factor spp2 [Ophiocordyceps camponoti-floridani]|uniref:Pre-mRNA-splicing factor n=1 Tax=Ophiocordyceps camponoti-floridani TaxID=2030778 RepID=A0A8H4Q9I5_9HYPO|nr:pre-mRNA-splicing factor spp2 [Ophiocordyceps camponoti-floridani]
MTNQDKSRIALNFGAFKPSQTLPPPPAARPGGINLGKRPRADAFADSDSDDERPVQHEVITGFGIDGAETLRKPPAKKRDLIIACPPNRDWRAELRAKRQRGPLPTSQRGVGTVEREPADDDKDVQWGLNVPSKREDADDSAEKPPTTTPKINTTDNTSQPPPTADDEALDALLDRKPHRPKTIPLSEDAAYRRDVATAGAPSTLEDYEAMPVEDFGAALLRGMGWDGNPRGPKVKEVRRRANRLGLGAKELNEAEDLGGWNQTKKRRPRLDEYRREESRRKDERRRHDDSYKREREREREQERDGYRGGRDGGSERERRRDDRYRDHERDRRR